MYKKVPVKLKPHAGKCKVYVLSIFLFFAN